MVPSIYTITPAQGLTSGRSVHTITGSGFRLYEPPPSGQVPGASIGWVPSVRVEVDGRSADAVAVLSAEQCLVVTPEYRGDPDALPATVDVRLLNLDDDGDPIPGEEHTLADGFTYRRPDLTALSSLLWVVRQYVLWLRRHLLGNVSLSASPDFSTEPALRVTFTGSLPAVVLEGPRMKTNRFHRNSVPRIESGPSGMTKKTSPFTADLIFGIMVVGRTKAEALNLKNAAIRLFDRRPNFVFPAGPTDPTDVRVRSVVVGDWESKDNFTDQVFSFENDVRLEGLELDDSYDLANAGVPVDDFFVALTEDTPGFLDLDTESADG